MGVSSFHRAFKQTTGESPLQYLKKLRLLDVYKKENGFRQYQAIVASVKPAGITFEVADLMLEGFLHISELGNDYYRFDQKRARLIGDQSGQSFHCGDKITVMLKEVDLIRREATWSIVQ